MEFKKIQSLKSLLTTEFLSFSGKGSFTSDRGSSGFLSSELGKNFDCTKELKRKKNIPLKSMYCFIIIKSEVLLHIDHKKLTLAHQHFHIAEEIYRDLNFIKKLVLCCTEHNYKEQQPDVQTAVSLVATQVTEQKLNFK